MMGIIQQEENFSDSELKQEINLNEIIKLEKRISGFLFDFAEDYLNSKAVLVKDSEKKNHQRIIKFKRSELGDKIADLF